MRLPVYKIFLGKKALYTKIGLHVHRCFQGTVKGQIPGLRTNKTFSFSNLATNAEREFRQAMRRAYVLNVLEMQAYLLQVTGLLVKRIVQFYSSLSLTENDNQEVNPISFRENRNL